VDTVSSLWLVPLLPLVAGAVSSFLPVSQKKLAMALAVGAMVASFGISLNALLHALHMGDVKETHDFVWITVGAVKLELGVLLDPLTAAMIAMVTFVGTLIFLYSWGYMHHDARTARFFAFLALFAGGMLGLCVANSLVLLFVCWEIVGVSSYLLIGFWFHKPSAAAAAKKAFLVTKLGDVGFFVGLIWLYGETGTQLFYDGGAGLLEASTIANLAAIKTAFFGMNLAGVLALLLFCGAVGKSGQFPLHVWLPDAMEGPTPVSALIHAATMVAAGVFLVGRTYALFEAEPISLQVVMWIGAFTAILAASIAVAQNDIKRILAYSTVSQLGLMMLGLGAAGVTAGIFHLLTHAFFKALLFLGAGSVIHACHDEQDIWKMGGLRKHMPLTFPTYLIGSLALAGVPPLAGFWSKDEILHGAWHHGHIGPFVLGALASLLTAFYMTRQVALVFFGKQRDEHLHPHESPAIMTAPLVILAVFALFAGLIGTPWANFFHHFLEPKAPAGSADVMFMVAATALPVVGIGAGWLLYGTRTFAPGAKDPLAGLPLYGALQKRWYWDEIYEATVVKALHALSWIADLLDALLSALLDALAGVARMLAGLSRRFDTHGIMNGARVVGFTTKAGGYGFARLQNGRTQSYVAGAALGAAVLIGMLAWMLWRGAA
jgi:NADH-quinone oxidoreductase subunit L